MERLPETDYFSSEFIVDLVSRGNLNFSYNVLFFIEKCCSALLLGYLMEYEAPPQRTGTKWLVPVVSAPAFISQEEPFERSLALIVATVS